MIVAAGLVRFAQASEVGPRQTRMTDQGRLECADGGGLLRRQVVSIGSV